MSKKDYSVSAEKLRNAIDLLDGFRRPPFPIHDLAKKKVSTSTLVRNPIDVTLTNDTVVRIIKAKNDNELRDKWYEFKEAFRKFLPVYQKYELSMRKLNFMVFGIISVVIFGLGFLVAQMNLPLFVPGIVGVVTFIIVILFYRRYELERVNALREKWKHGNLVRDVVNLLLLHLCAEIKKQSLNANQFTFASNFKDYSNATVVEDHGSWYLLKPKIKK